MTTYTVQHNDTPAIIAKKLTGNVANMNALIIANPQKKWVSSISASSRFRISGVGERLNLPSNWII